MPFFIRSPSCTAIYDGLKHRGLSVVRIYSARELSGVAFSGSLISSATLCSGGPEEGLLRRKRQLCEGRRPLRSASPTAAAARDSTNAERSQRACRSWRSPDALPERKAFMEISVPPQIRAPRFDRGKVVRAPGAPIRISGDLEVREKGCERRRGRERPDQRQPITQLPHLSTAARRKRPLSLRRERTLSRPRQGKPSDRRFRWGLARLAGAPPEEGPRFFEGVRRCRVRAAALLRLKPRARRRGSSCHIIRNPTTGSRCRPTFGVAGRRSELR
ncbi:hypothetical protein MRX96_005366 [Rhipicephalus microplus]